MRFWRWLIAGPSEATYVQQLEAWAVSEPYITALETPRGEDAQGAGVDC
jgi:hypothetical protein